MSTKHRQNRRPWYAHDGLTDEYRKVALEKGDGDLKMLKTLKIIRSIIVIVAISVISLYALHLGANPTLVAVFSLPSLGGYTVAETVDYIALIRGFLEAKEATETATATNADDTTTEDGTDG